MFHDHQDPRSNPISLTVPHLSPSISYLSDLVHLTKSKSLHCQVPNRRVSGEFSPSLRSSSASGIFLRKRSSIRAVVGNAFASADSELIDNIDLAKCKEKGIRVSYTPDVLTEDVADLAIGLILATLRGICECDRWVVEERGF